jgi:hypothetical protein
MAGGYAQERFCSEHVGGELVENMLFGGFGVLANHVDLAVRATTMVTAHDATV